MYVCMYFHRAIIVQFCFTMVFKSACAEIPRPLWRVFVEHLYWGSKPPQERGGRLSYGMFFFVRLGRRKGGKRGGPEERTRERRGEGEEREERKKWRIENRE